MGNLLLEGGAEFGGRMSEPDLRAIELAGGSDIPICIIPTAAAPDRNHKRAGNNGVHWFQSLGAKNVFAVDVISSAGLRALLNIYKMFTLHDEETAWHKVHAGELYKSPYLKLACASIHVNNVLAITGFLQNISIYPSVEEALRSFSE